MKRAELQKIVDEKKEIYDRAYQDFLDANKPLHECIRNQEAELKEAQNSVEWKELHALYKSLENVTVIHPIEFKFELRDSDLDDEDSVGVNPNYFAFHHKYEPEIRSSQKFIEFKERSLKVLKAVKVWSERFDLEPATIFYSLKEYEEDNQE